MCRMGLKLCTKGRVIEAQTNTVTSEEKLRGGIRWQKTVKGEQGRHRCSMEVCVLFGPVGGSRRTD